MELWHDLARQAGVTLGPRQIEQLEQYIDLLLDANQRMNLTRIADRDSARLGHIADALTLLPHLPTGPARLVDVGTGGGVPGIPLAIARPDLSVTLIESTGKKAAVLREMIVALQLPRVQVLNERAESVGQSPLRETFDVAVARAVGELVWIAEWCLPLVKTKGRVLAMKGPRVVSELPAARKAIRILGGASPVVHPSNLPGDSEHVIVQINKIGPANPRYPRLATMAKGKPLA